MKKKGILFCSEEGSPDREGPVKKKTKVDFCATFFHDKQGFFILEEEGCLLGNLLPRKKRILFRSEEGRFLGDLLPYKKQFFFGREKVARTEEGRRRRRRRWTFDRPFSGQTRAGEEEEGGLLSDLLCR